MKSVLHLFSEHGTFIQPDAVTYIQNKEKPREFAETLLKNLKEYPLILTMDHILTIEEHTKPQETPPLISEKPSEETEKTRQQTEEEKQIQRILLTKLYSGNLRPKTDEDDEEEDDDPDKDDQLSETNGTQEPDLHPVEIKKIKGWKPLAKEYHAELRIIKDVSGKSTCEGTTQDFAKLFKYRYTVIRKILQTQRRELANVLPINRIKKSGTNDVQLIGIVKNVRTTSHGHRLIELEDETGTAPLIALKTNPDALQLASEVVLDEIIGVTSKLSKNGDLLIIQNIVFPDISIQHNKQKAEVPVHAAFLSDIHIGSKMFLEDQWHSFLKWINGNLGNTRQKDVAGKIKYLIVPGDLVDGIGIYPNQEKELSIRDIYRQYEALAQQFQLIPDYITILIQPGNHDAVRPAEPQPAFEKEIQQLFSGNDVVFAANPCYFSVHGVEVLSYHGQSLLDFATNIPQLKYNEPLEIMKLMLRKRHLAPTYGGYTPLAPEHMDYMIIDRVPDIFVTGHVHLAALADYRGVTMINASSWQAQTTYQKMLNFIPDSAKLPIVDLKTGNATTMDFSQPIT
ncbi:MAG: DNA-directed DNA polymerase II small subunit [Methanobacteriota archaeon]